METSQEQIIQQVYDYTVKRLVLDKASTETAKDELTEQSVNEEKQVYPSGGVMAGNVIKGIINQL